MFCYSAGEIGIIADCAEDHDMQRYHLNVNIDLLAVKSALSSQRIRLCSSLAIKSTF